MAEAFAIVHHGVSEAADEQTATANSSSITVCGSKAREYLSHCVGCLNHVSRQSLTMGQGRRRSRNLPTASQQLQKQQRTTANGFVRMLGCCSLLVGNLTRLPCDVSPGSIWIFPAFSHSLVRNTLDLLAHRSARLESGPGSSSRYRKSRYADHARVQKVRVQETDGIVTTCTRKMIKRSLESALVSLYWTPDSTDSLARNLP